MLSSEFQLGLLAFPTASQRPSHSGGEDVVLARFSSLRRLRHPNLCRYLDALIGRDHWLFVISEHASVTLADLVRAHPHGLKEDFVVITSRQLVNALCFLNTHGFVHGHLEAASVLLGEDGGLKLTGHGLGHLVAHGKWADFPLRPSGACMAPDSAQGGGAGEEGAGLQLSCKPDVWAVGIMILELLHGPWLPPQGQGHGSEDEADLVMKASVILETARAIKQFADNAGTLSGALSAVVILGEHALAGTAPGATTDAATLCLPSVVRLDGDQKMRVAEESYRQWMTGRSSSVGSQTLRDFWSVCLTVHPRFRPAPLDLASHPAVGGEGVERKCMGGFRWTDCPALQSERLEQCQRPMDLHGYCKASTSPVQYLRNFGARAEDLHYWWMLAGGDPFDVLVRRHYLRPVPPVLRLPLLVRDAGPANESGSSYSFLSSNQKVNGPAGACQPSLELAQECSRGSLGGGADGAGTGAAPPYGGQALAGSELRGLWGPLGSVRPRCLGVELRGLCKAVAAAESMGRGAIKSLRLPSIYDRHHHFAYQWLRVRQFRRLLLTSTRSRSELFSEAAEDIPPVLRAKVWLALFGSDMDSFASYWGPFYEQLLATPGPGADGEERLLTQRRQPSPRAYRSPAHNECVERLVHAVLRANPSVTCAQGLRVIAGPWAALYEEKEAAAFFGLQQLLHGFLWHSYTQDGGVHRRQCVQLFGALLGFADPELAHHLQGIGMQVDVYASDWFSTWFGQVFSFQQLVLLWDTLLLRPPQFSLFVGVCLMHFYRRALLSVEEVSQASSFLASCLQLVDVGALSQASAALFQAVPASVTLPLFPRHSAGEALLSPLGSGAVTSVDPAWQAAKEEAQRSVASAKGDGADLEEDQHLAAARFHMEQRAERQCKQCEWWRRRAATSQVPPIITVDDLLSFRTNCLVLDVQNNAEYLEGHFQGSSHVQDPESGDLKSILPAEVLTLGCAQQAFQSSTSAVPNAAQDGQGQPATSPPWLFEFDPAASTPAELRLRLVVVVGGSEDSGAAFAERLLCAGIRHVACLLGGAAALRVDAPRYLTSGAD